ncbi:YdiK family protein [Calidifontibacillus oryziterrae]|uniref:YdiK family protein n=1 Tax=Calidifontibacillus oryziterrae TaxID=1191699 RepID=UPI0002EED0AF|nr:YdiK family protein [Calidifontibacillus oryziterrae]
MRPTPYTLGFIYAAMGIMFTFLAIETAQKSIWNVSTILLMLIATFDFSTAIRFFTYKRRLQNNNHDEC